MNAAVQILMRRGWTKEILRERMRDCLLGIREAKQRNDHATWTYRFLFTRMYLRHKKEYFILADKGNNNACDKSS